MATENAVLSGLEPGACWRHFEALTKIARPSRQEELVIEHIRSWAAEQGSRILDVSGYAASKAAIRNLAQTLARHHARDGVRLYIQRRLDELSLRVDQHPAEPIKPDTNTLATPGADRRTD